MRKANHRRRLCFLSGALAGCPATGTAKLMSDPLAPGEDCLLIDTKGRYYLIRLTEGAEFHSHLGRLPHAEIIGAREGSSVVTEKGSRLAVFCAGWYLLNLAPKLPLLAANDLMLDHWVYLANAGLFLWAASALYPLRKLFPAAALILIMASAVNITRRDTDLKIYEHGARRSQSKPMLYNLAREYYLLGRTAESLPILEKITTEDPGNAMYLNGLALARWRGGDTPGALAALDAALAAKPGSAETHYNRYCVLAAAGKKEAGAALAASLQADPRYAPSLLAAARLNAGAGRRLPAAAFYTRLLEINPYDLEGLNDYGILLAMGGDPAGARELFSRALKVAPGLVSARQNLARLAALEKK